MLCYLFLSCDSWCWKACLLLLTVAHVKLGSKAKQAIFDKATELGMKAALTLADEQPLLGLADYKRLLEEEEDHFARLGWDFLPGSVKVAYEGLLLAMDEACHELKVQSAIIKSRQALPIENQHFHLSEACSLGSGNDSTEQIQLASVRPMTEEMRSIDMSYGNEVAAERQRPASVYYVEEVLERIANPDSLQAAYQRIKSKLQIMSMKTDDEWNDFGWKLFTQSAQSLRTGTYNFTPVNIIQVRKPGKEGSVRPVVVVNPKDQIVVEAIRFELEKIYEPIFLNAAHRHQASRSCHMAIKYIKNGWKGTTWFIQFKSQTTYNRAHLEKLLSILSTHIKDKQFLNLLKEMMRMGLLNLVDPGSQFSALLCNIFYHQLDLEVARIKADWSTGSNYQEMSSAAYSSLHLDQKMLTTTRGNPELKSLGKQQGPERSGHAQGAEDIKIRRVHYVRYAEEFLFGIKGTKTMALDVLERVQTFLQTELKLQMP